MLSFQHTKLRMVALRRKAARPPDDNHDGAVRVLCYCSKRVRCSAGCGGVGLSISSNVARPWLWPISAEEKARWRATPR